MAGQAKDTVSTRAFYRVSYPLPERPHFIWGDMILEVLDCSEGGFRFLTGRPVTVAVGDQVEGVVRFRRGNRVAVRGRVAWLGDGQAAVALEGTWIPLPTIYSEQRYLRKHYPMWS